MINVTEPFLPPFEEYVDCLRGIWDRNWLTNQGPLVKEFEAKLQECHQVDMPVHCVANGSLGLQIALKALGVSGEVITTPFSYVATTACPLWEGCSVKFADIEPDTLTIDPASVEAAITPDTEAILATHVFGNPCDVEALDAIARKHGLAMIYDAAHAFGIRYNGKSILEYGDATMVSLHATKLMHSVEGGFLVAKDLDVSAKMEWMRRFGHKGLEEFHGVGTNAKLSEFHAAMGLCNLNHLDEILSLRKQVCDAYDEALFSGGASGNQQLSSITYRGGASRNYSYYPILFETENELLNAVKRLSVNGIYPRRYFYPDLSEVFSSKSSVPYTLSAHVSRRILCLPLYPELKFEDVDRIASAIITHE